MTPMVWPKGQKSLKCEFVQYITKKCISVKQSDRGKSCMFAIVNYDHLLQYRSKVSLHVRASSDPRVLCRLFTSIFSFVNPIISHMQSFALKYRLNFKRDSHTTSYTLQVFIFKQCYTRKQHKSTRTNFFSSKFY